jgi:hypothetical protein
MSVVSLEKIYEDGSVVQPCPLGKVKVFTKEEALEDYLSDNYTFSHSLWLKLYKRDVISSIVSPEGYTCEDDYVSLVSILNCNKIVYDYTDYMYVYRMRADSVSAKKYNINNLDMFYMQSYCFDALAEYPRLQSLNARRIIRSYISFVGIVYGRGLKSDKAFIERLKDMRSKTKLYCKSAQLSKSEKIAFFAAKYFPSLFGIVYSRFHVNIKSITDTPPECERDYIVRYEEY